MISGDHKKHSETAKVQGGNWAREEWAILGTTCEKIKDLSNDIFNVLSANWRCGYADAVHKENAESSQDIFKGSTSTILITHENFQEIIQRNQASSYQMKEEFRDLDLLLVNGNHHEAYRQILVLDPVKKNSIEKRLDKLSNVELILLTDHEEDFEFLKETIATWSEIPKFKLNDRNSIINFFESRLSKAVPKINGLVLTGGKSTRMGRNKSKMDWHGKEQQYFVADLLSKFCEEVFISCTENQLPEIDKEYKTVPDSFLGLGPMSGILTAFRFNPNMAWLVLACDLPLLDEEIIEELIANRKSKFMATAFESELDGFPEPLITIWEPKSYPVLLSFLAQGVTCPRKVLRNNEINLIHARNGEKLFNANTPEDADLAKKLLIRNASVH